MYETYVKGHKDRLAIIHEKIDEDASLHWIGPKSSKRVMLYFHGTYNNCQNKNTSHT